MLQDSRSGLSLMDWAVSTPEGLPASPTGMRTLPTDLTDGNRDWRSGRGLPGKCTKRDEGCQNSRLLSYVSCKKLCL